jgi:proteasome lid subunit RPN8/RPN11
VIDENGHAWACENSAKDRQKSYFITPQEWRRVTRSRSVCGVYHSHCDTTADISKGDVEAFSGSMLYIIASVIRGEMKDIHVYRRIDGRMVRVQ